MSKRLQVLLDEDELREIQRIARTRRMTVAEWVRQALRSAGQSEPLREASKKLEVVRAAARHSFPRATSSRCSATSRRVTSDGAP